MALVSRASGMFTKQKRIWVNGYLAGSVVGGLDFDPARREASRDIYGDPNGVQIVTYGPGPQSIDIMENPNSSLLNEILAGITSKAATAPVVIRSGSQVQSCVAVVETLNALNTGYKNGSTYLGHWAATLGTARGDPGAEAIRTLAGPADVPIECLRGAQFMSKRITLTSGAGGWQGTFTPVPVALADLSNKRAVYLEIQSGTGRDRIVSEIAVDTTNVQSSGSAGLVTIAHADVIDSAFSTIDGCWLVFGHVETTLQTHDCRWPAT